METGRRAHWERVYQTKNPTQVSWYQADPARSLALIERTGVTRTEPILDVGGGTSLLADRLVEAGHGDITVLDVAASALECVRQRLGTAVRLIQSDILHFDPPRHYALWHDRAVLHFLTDPVERVAYVDVLTRALRPEGHVLLATFALDGPARCSGLSVERYDAPRMAALLGPAFRLRSAETETHLTPAGVPQHFQYGWFTRTQ